MKTKELIVDALLGYAGVKIGERLGKSVVKLLFKKRLEKHGHRFINWATNEEVVVVDVVSRGLREPAVIYETGGKIFQISLDSFTESFYQCTIKEGN